MSSTVINPRGLIGWMNSARYRQAVVADVHDSEAIFDPAIRAYTPDVPLYGLALTVYCAAGDNLMLHKAVSMVAPGDVIVVQMEATPSDTLVRSLAGEILAYGAYQRGAHGMVLDALIRDVDEIRKLGLAMYARDVCIRGPLKQTLGTINHPIRVGGVTVSPGDVIIGDRDGLVCVSPDQGEAVLARAQERLDAESEWKEKIAAGGTTNEFLGFQDKLIEMGIKEESET